MFVTNEEGAKFALGSLTQVRPRAGRLEPWAWHTCAASRAHRAALRRPARAPRAQTRSPHAGATSAAASAARLSGACGACAAATLGGCAHAALSLRRAPATSSPSARACPSRPAPRRVCCATRLAPAQRSAQRPAPAAARCRLPSDARARRPQVTFTHTGSFPVYLTGHLSEDDDMDFGCAPHGAKCALVRRFLTLFALFQRHV